MQQPAPAARLQPRHVAVLVSFLVLVLVPVALSSAYLWVRAADQYASRLGFAVRQTQVASPGGLSALTALAGIPALSGSTADDGNILNEYLRSRDLVAEIDDKLDLRRIWSRPGDGRDPVFACAAPGTIEDLHRYWGRMVHVAYDRGTGLISVEVRAFDARDAEAIARAIFAAADKRINALGQIAREDTLHLARRDLDEAEERLASAETALTDFRNRTRIVDPAASLEGQMGLLDRLEAALAEVLIERDLLVGTTAAEDPRLQRLDRKIDVIRARVEDEKSKLGLGGHGDSSGAGGAYAELVGEYQRLAVDQRFAEEAWIAARAAFDRATAEARRQTRYLAAYVPPTLAERAEYPRRLRMVFIIGAFALMAWTLAVVTGYSLRDRR